MAALESSAGEGKPIFHDVRKTGSKAANFRLGVWLKMTQFKIFIKELHLPSPFAKAGDLFWLDFPKFHFFVDQGGPNRKDWSE